MNHPYNLKDASMRVYILWLREVRREWRERSRIIASIVAPLLWLFVFGSGLSPSTSPIHSINFQQFLFPGVICLALLFSSTRSGTSVIFDKEFGFMKEILVSPSSTPIIVLGKALGGATASLLQGTIVLVLFPFVRVSLTPIQFILAFPLMIIIALGLECIGMAIGSLMESIEGFQLIISFVTLPMFFLSGAIFPLSNAPAALKFVSIIDPLTYGVDLMRGMMLGISIRPIYLNFTIVLAFDLVMLFICSLLFRKNR